MEGQQDPIEVVDPVASTQKKVSFDVQDDRTAAPQTQEEEEPDQEPSADDLETPASAGSAYRRRRAQSCLEPGSNALMESSAGAGNAAEELAACLQDLSLAEERFGTDDARVARCLRRMAVTLACHGRSAQAVPLWIRVIEIERPLLGSQHPDLLALEKVVRKELSQPGVSEDAAAEYELRLAQTTVSNPPLTGGAAKEATESPNLAAAAASLGVSSAAAVGGAVVSGALSLSLSAVSSTASIVTNATSSLVSYAASGTAAAMVRATPASEPMVSIAANAAGYASSGAIEVARSSAGMAFSAVSQAGISLAASATSSAISYAGQGAWRALSRRSSDAESVAASDCDPAVQNPSGTVSGEGQS
eukprot:TRINITY_DN109545_c0_g1_i1.p1 TRINITY_DN109545_c0_g1~~TRINITY_DN109545_c0_g1_i1.p1  ORF type:complete len:402 (-),score=95.69 TRINITY_DN109545_c0_g1_i1:43-1128(-)